ncbi:MAG: hypothetical protein JRE38_13710 [Deltaproteobacteria bacterium]|nr:hypothetical protein [Deltaproteobacteria bacterium]
MDGLPGDTAHLVRARRIGWRDVPSAGHLTPPDGSAALDLTMQRHTDVDEQNKLRFRHLR